MRMIPPVIDVNAPSGEKEIFQLLKETNSKKFKDCLVFIHLIILKNKKIKTKL